MRKFKVTENGQDVPFENVWSRAHHSFRSFRTLNKSKEKKKRNQRRFEQRKKLNLIKIKK